MELSDKRCVPCRSGVPVLEAEEAGRLVSQVSGWTLEEEARGIRRGFRFRTHSIRGLHENDFIMAAKVNRLLQTGLPPS